MVVVQVKCVQLLETAKDRYGANEFIPLKVERLEEGHVSKRGADFACYVQAGEDKLYDAKRWCRAAVHTPFHRQKWVLLVCYSSCLRLLVDRR